MKILNYVVGPLATNSYILYDEETMEALMIDPGSSELVTKVRDLIGTGLRFNEIIATHGHIDHVAGVKELRKVTSAKFSLHKLDVEILDVSLDWGWELGLDVKFDDVRPDNLYDGGEVIRLGRYEIEVIHTPGHTPGSVVFNVPALKIAFTGDTLFHGSVGRTDLMGGSWQALKESIKKLVVRLDSSTIIYPGHGPSSTIGYEVVSNVYVKRILKG